MSLEHDHDHDDDHGHGHGHHHPEPEIRISLLVPFRADGRGRTRVWRWLRRYWEHELPGVEIVMGHDDFWRRPFSKTVAVNNAAKKAHGDIFVILDADTYLPGRVIEQCANRIRTSIAAGHPLWFIPYRKLFRLTAEATDAVLDSDPRDPLRFSSPPLWTDVEDTSGSAHGHHYGAMIQIMPRVGFEKVGGMDPMFRGWGGEDVAFVRAMDTLYAKHKSTSNDVLHLWHPIHNQTYIHNWTVREWAGQRSNRMNDRRAVLYDKATGDPVMMRALVDEDFRQYATLRHNLLTLFSLSSLFVVGIVTAVLVVFL